MGVLASLWRNVAGLLVAGLVAVASLGIAALETWQMGHPVVEALVVALVVGMLVRFVWSPREVHQPGLRFASKTLLEIAVVLLGVSIDFSLLARAGVSLALAVVAIVAGGLAIGVLIARALGLSPKLSILVATGNAICGNSAIAAVAPVIESNAEDVASSIAFTAILGVVVVVSLPLLIAPLGLTHYQYGVLAGLTVYAVPQVLAAAFPVSALAGDVATLVKLVRVLMLGPVVLFFAVRMRQRRMRNALDAANPGSQSTRLPPLGMLVPWFIIGFVVVAALRGIGVLPAGWVPPARAASTYLTILAMAALGLSADPRAVARAGSRVVAAVSLSLAVLVALALAAIGVLHIR
jgi:uncharacterized integral membrane protein (TIGR00698 family)